MKASFKIFCTIILGILISFSGFTQECNAALFLKPGNVLEYTSYDKKGKVSGSAIHETLSLKEDGDKIIATIKVTSKDDKKKNEFSSEYEATCQNGLFSVDMMRFFDSQQLQQYDADDFTITMDGNVLEFPAGMKPGDALNDGNFTVKVNKDAFTIVTMLFNITNRQIHPNESITTDAGTFDCQKVTYDFDSKMGFIKIKGSGVEWYNNDKAIVKSESYSKKGKLLGYSELTGKTE